MHRDFRSISMCCRGIFNVLRDNSNVLRNFIISTLEVLRNTSNLQSAAEILQPTQHHSGRRSTAALLPLKYLYLCTCTYMHMCIGVSKERRLKCCALRQSGSVSRLDYRPSMAGAR
mgnify:CR=1